MNRTLTAAISAAAAALLAAVPAHAAPTSGTFLVPSQISPGTYMVVSTDGTGTGYWATCATYVCEPGNGMIGNDFFNNSSIMVVPVSAVSVELDGVTVTKLTDGVTQARRSA